MKIMLVEDSAVERLHIARQLEDWGLDFVAADNGAEAWRILQEPEAPTLVLLDWMLPEIDGIELCRRIRTLGATGNYIYTVMLTAKDRKANLLTAMEAGADDYLAKPVDASELRARILVGKRILELQESLRFSATHDFLTRLLNRGEILASLKREVSRSEREARPTSIILGDLDHFKRVNDTFGHGAGDAVLKEVGVRLQSELRDYDLVGRYGGEEFLLILPNCPLTVGTRRAEEVTQLVSEKPVFAGATSIPVTISMGVTATDVTRTITIENLLQQADIALYRAKNNGRNRVETYFHEKAKSASV